MKEAFTHQIEKDFASLKTNDSEWLQGLRQLAFEQFFSLGYPTVEQEEWRYTRLGPLLQIPFRLARGESERSPRPELVESYLGKLVNWKSHPFAALNTAFFGDVTLVHIPKGTRRDQPIELKQEAPSNGEPRVSHPRYLIVADEGSEATVIERFQGPKEIYFTNIVTEVVVKAGAHLEHYRIQEEGEKAFHLAETAVSIGHQGSYRSYWVSLGGHLVRNTIETRLEDEGAECLLNGLYLASGDQHVDNQTSIEHTRPQGTSLELYKGILNDEATAVFNGRIVVRPEAPKTNARQTNKNLLLSDNAVVNTKPLLEIQNNDVKCNHGAAIGRLDLNQVFYLRSRGLGDAEARGLLIYAFASEVLQSMRWNPLRQKLQKYLFEKLSLKKLAPLEGMI